MPKLDKSTLALTFRYDSDRFLKFRLTSEETLGRIGALKVVTDGRGRPHARPHVLRPGLGLAKAAGAGWEILKFEDLIDAVGRDRVHHRRSSRVHRQVKRRRFLAVGEQELLQVLGRFTPPDAVIEAEFLVPDDITEGLRRAHADHRLDPVRARPDILWIRRASASTPLMTPPGRRRVPGRPPFEIHVIDVKYSAEPSLRHFTEVTFYAMALERWLERHGLDDRFAVSAQGLVWPGTHEVGAFRSRVRDLRYAGEPDPVRLALGETLVPVPYEVYRVHVRQFFDGRLLRVLGTDLAGVEYHVSPTCQLCDYLPYCERTAHETDHLSRIAWLTRGQADLLRQHGIRTVAALYDAIARQTDGWRGVKADSPQLRAEEAILLARAEALTTGRAVLAAGRKTAAMPAYADMRIYVTVHFDFSTGITFAFGAKRVYYRPGAPQGAPPDVEEMAPAIVDKVDRTDMPASERARLLDFAQTVTRWLREADAGNRQITDDRKARGQRDSAFGKVRAHIYVWDALELRQLRRTFARHMEDPAVMQAAEEFVRMFPPDEVLPDPDSFRSQPGTVVKDVVRVLVGLPIPHDYTLFEVANAFHPPTRLSARTGRPVRFGVPWGFAAPMSDQIPFERAHELWLDDPEGYMLRHRPAPGQTHGRRYQRAEVIDGIRYAVRMRLAALEHVDREFRRHHPEVLTLKKAPFYAAPLAPPLDAPAPSRRLWAFQQLEAISKEIEHRALHALPVDEREARFHSLRGLRPLPAGAYATEFATLLSEKPRYRGKRLEAFRFSPGSRDARINEGDFTLALSNEGRPGDPGAEPFAIDVPWRVHLGLSYPDAKALARDEGIEPVLYRAAEAALSQLLEVEVARLDATASEPVVVLAFNNPDAFDFAVRHGLVSLEHPLVLDPVHRDFETSQVKRVLLELGGAPARPAPGVAAAPGQLVRPAGAAPRPAAGRRP
ncbi:MAG: hypothetical protein WKG32_10920 [Gemmatimonadaceae bacterium]